MRPAPRVTRWPIALLLAGSMVIVPLLALGSVDEADPTRVRVAADVAATDAELAARTTLLARASRSETAPAESTTTTTAAPTTTTSTTAAPATTTTAARPTTTTAKPTTTTTARPTTTTAKPTTTTSTTAKPTTTTTAAASNSAEGEASWYESPSGECAHRTLPFGTVVRVTATSTGRQVSCTVGDRGPYTGGRIIDLSRDAFAAIAPLEAGVIHVRIEW